MSLFNFAFYFFGIITLLSAGVVVFSKNIIHSAFSLLFTFFGVSALYVLLSADFLAVTQVLIYVGGILILLLFGVMLTNKVTSVDLKTGTIQTLPAAIVIAAIAGTLFGIFYSTHWLEAPVPLNADQGTITGLGALLLTDYLLPFEISSVVLLVALIGAAMIARRERRSIISQ